MTALSASSTRGRPFFFAGSETSGVGGGVRGGTGDGFARLDSGAEVRFFRGVLVRGFVTRIRTKEKPDDLKVDISQSTAAVSSPSLGNRCPGINAGPSSTGALSRNPHAIRLPRIRSSKT